MAGAPPFLRMPPFPGARVRQLAWRRPRPLPLDEAALAEAAALAAALREEQVGGDFWGARPVGVAAASGG
ncbi:MAG TPA: capsule biosynthesis protein, partial [Novosphingobium sp.]|nr:capsule biosynthesis protein [Novosphingobium sp.]